MTSLNLFNVTATSSGLTTATTGYTDGDVLGDELSWDVGSDKGIIIGAVLTDESDIIGAVDLYLFDRAVTFGTDNAAPSISDADLLFALGVIQFPNLGVGGDLGGARVSAVDSLAVPFDCNASNTLHGALVTRSSHTFFSSGGADSLQVRLLGSQDV